MESAGHEIDYCCHETDFGLVGFCCVDECTCCGFRKELGKPPHAVMRGLSVKFGVIALIRRGVLTSGTKYLASIR